MPWRPKRSHLVADDHSDDGSIVMARGPHASLGFDLADGSDHGIEARQYDAENRLAEQALPSAVTGFNDAQVDLGVSLRAYPKSTVMGEFAFLIDRARRAPYPQGQLGRTQLSTGLRPQSTSLRPEGFRLAMLGRYPKLKGSTLSYPALEPPTEHHSFSTGLLTAVAFANAPALGVKTTLLVCFSGRTNQREL